jgi:hypothetical protein
MFSGASTIHIHKGNYIYRSTVNKDTWKAAIESKDKHCLECGMLNLELALLFTTHISSIPILTDATLVKQSLEAWRPNCTGKG